MQEAAIYKQPVALNCLDKTQNTGITSVDRSTKATLSTYNTWIQLSRLQKIYHPQSLKLRLTTEAFDGRQWLAHNWAEAYPLTCNNEGGGQHCLSSTDSGLEAFNRYPTDGSFAVIAFQLAAFTKYLNEVFLSY